MGLDEFVAFDAAWLKRKQNMKLNAACLAVILILCVAPAVCPAQDFSADVVNVDGKVNAGSPGADTSAHKLSRLFVSKGKIRLEMGGPTGTVLVVNAAEQTVFALFPAKKEYEPLAGGVSEYFRVSDAEDVCPDWQKVSAQKVDCERVGYEVVNGRKTVKYRNKSASDVAVSAVWIDLEMKFVVKWEGAGTGVELRNIQEAQQAADLFTLPSDYEVPKPRKGAKKGFSHRGR
jgi:hypothetical protein